MPQIPVFNALFVSAHMKADKSRFSTQHSCGADITGQTDQFLCRDIRRTVIGDRKLHSRISSINIMSLLTLPVTVVLRITIGSADRIGGNSLFF